MAIVVGITGGIGSGKTTIINYISELGYKTYNADNAGKEILKNTEVVLKIKEAFLPLEVVVDGEIDRKKMASIVFKDKKQLEKLNSIIHPAVAKDFEMVVKSLSEKELIFKESAILFESGAYKKCDVNILITAPESLRIERVIERDAISENQIRERISNQMLDEEKSKLADYIIENIHLSESFSAIKEIISKILRN